MRHGVQSLRESWCHAECAPGRTQDERGPLKAMAVASFCAPEIGRTPFRVSRTMAMLRVNPENFQPRKFRYEEGTLKNAEDGIFQGAPRVGRS